MNMSKLSFVFVHFCKCFSFDEVNNKNLHDTLAKLDKDFDFSFKKGKTCAICELRTEEKIKSELFKGKDFVIWADSFEDCEEKSFELTESSKEIFPQL